MNLNGSEANRKDVELLAYELWEQRGRPIGSPDEDWLRAQEYYRADEVSAEVPYSSTHSSTGARANEQPSDEQS